MGYSAQRIPYRETGLFSPLVMNYLDHHPSLQSFFSHEASLRGIKDCIALRQQIPVDRNLLADRLTKQYAGMEMTNSVQKNLNLLRQDNCYTVTTAHQNNLFSGPLYFIYKIVHAIALAEYLKRSIPDCNFVPVFYLGTEDADLAELDHVHIGAEKIQWNTRQTGAVGRMSIDQEMVKLIDRIEGQLGVFPHGAEWISLLRACYVEGRTMAEATFRLV
ncbi:MAG: bacillithiol biosynthesis BshC, partial [Sphingomonadales bacterium]